MAKVTLTLSDDVDDSLDFKIEFEPPLEKDVEPTPAQTFGIALAEQVLESGESVEVLEIE